MRPRLAATAIAAVLLATAAQAQAGRTGTGGGPATTERAPNVTGVGQTKPPSRDEAPASTAAPVEAAPDGGKTEEQKRAELVEQLRKGTEARRARDRASDALMARWEFAVCLDCNQSLKPFRRVWTHPLRVLAGIPALDDDRRQVGRGARWASLVLR